MSSRPRTNRPAITKAVLEREETCCHLLADLEALGSARRKVSLTPVQDALCHGLAPWLRSSITGLVALDEEVFTLQARLVQVRQQRDTALRQLAHDVAQLRLSIENQYKNPEIELLGFESPTPRSPQPLLRVATRVAKNLAQPDLVHHLGQPWYQNPFDPTTHQAQLDRQIEDLRHLLHQVDTLQRDLDQARICRQQAQKDHDILVREARQILGSVEKLNQLAHSQAPRPQQPDLQARGPRQNLESRASQPSPGSRRDPIPKPRASAAPPWVVTPSIRTAPEVRQDLARGPSPGVSPPHPNPLPRGRGRGGRSRAPEGADTCTGKPPRATEVARYVGMSLAGHTPTHPITPGDFGREGPLAPHRPRRSGKMPPQLGPSKGPYPPIRRKDRGALCTRRPPLSGIPKGSDTKAQGKRSAALGCNATHPDSPERAGYLHGQAAASG